MHINDLPAASALADKLECARDALKRLGDGGEIIKRHQDGEIQVSVNIPVELDETNSHEPQFAVAMFPLPTYLIAEVIVTCRARLKEDIEKMTSELRELGVALAVN